MQLKDQLFDFKYLNKDLAYTDTESGDATILFLHGMGCNSYIWYPIVQNLKATHRCITLDFPGSGKSTQSEKKLSLHMLSENVISLIEHLSITHQELYIVAHSMGAQVAIITALKKRINIKKLILLAPAGLEEFNDFQKKGIMNSLSLLSLAPLGNQLFNQVIKPFLTATDTSIQTILNRVEKGISNENLKQYRKNIIESTEAMLNEPVSDKLNLLDLPVHIVYGTKDKMIPNPLYHTTSTENFASNALKSFKNATLEMIPNKGHFLPLEAVNETINSIKKSIEQNTM